MIIGLDYGGVISFAPDGWADTIIRARRRGHVFYLVSHAQDERGMDTRRIYCQRAGMTDLSFADLRPVKQEKEIRDRKAQLCQQYGIEIFIDDDLPRAMAVGHHCDRCAALYIPQNLWQVGQRLIEGLGEDW